MEPDFQRALTIVLIVGSLIAAIGTVLLFFIFRAFGSEKAGGTRHTGMIIALISFIFLCCLGILLLSYRGAN